MRHIGAVHMLGEKAVSRSIAFADPATVELVSNPIPPSWILDGAPQARSKQLAESADGTSMIMAWSCTAGSFTWNYAGDETVHIISGEVFVTDGDGAVRRLGPGDMAFFPAGSRSTWRIPQEVRKLAVCRHGMPRPFGTLLRVWNKLTDRASGFSARGAKSDEPAVIGAAGTRVASA
jgi:uncharacterized cupin superfamily protein